MGKLPKDFGERDAYRVKLLYRRGLAHGEPGPYRDLDQAREDLTKAATIDPQNREIRMCLDNCKEMIKKEREAEKARVAEEKRKKEEEKAATNAPQVEEVSADTKASISSNAAKGGRRRKEVELSA